ncbi:hypothetical protein BZG02_12770 [Labilibaculum filiforme]|uniref:Uncharacterized protein n=1 Tax=Labilibaculum filiforme TaxID=1940526 RepID=A0A2N3HX02_9BACT|nr:hypothetical protein BZG02_12770 [Labilibaculum filiforme]
MAEGLTCSEALSLYLKCLGFEKDDNESIIIMCVFFGLMLVGFIFILSNRMCILIDFPLIRIGLHGII